MPNTTGSVDLGSLSTEEEEALASLADQHPEDAPGATNEPERVPVDTAVLLVLSEEGEILILEPNTPVDPKRNPTGDLLYGMFATAMKDLAGQEIAQVVVQQQLAQARLMQEQMQAQQIKSQLKGL
jgi:hypothetical protein